MTAELLPKTDTDQNWSPRVYATFIDGNKAEQPVQILYAGHTLGFFHCRGQNGALLVHKDQLSNLKVFLTPIDKL